VRNGGAANLSDQILLLESIDDIILQGDSIDVKGEVIDTPPAQAHHDDGIPDHTWKSLMANRLIDGRDDDDDDDDDDGDDHPHQDSSFLLPIAPSCSDDATSSHHFANSSISPPSPASSSSAPASASSSSSSSASMNACISSSFPQFAHSSDSVPEFSSCHHPHNHSLFEALACPSSTHHDDHHKYSSSSILAPDSFFPRIEPLVNRQQLTEHHPSHLHILDPILSSLSESFRNDMLSMMPTSLHDLLLLPKQQAHHGDYNNIPAHDLQHYMNLQSAPSEARGGPLTLPSAMLDPFMPTLSASNENELSVPELIQSPCLCDRLEIPVTPNMHASTL
jgi:hypothetical protein